MRRGSLVAGYRKCGKASCGCAAQRHPGHGPSLSLTWQEGGKTRTKIIPAAARERTQAQIAEFRRFCRLSRELIEVSERLCDARLASEQAEAQATAKKGGSNVPRVATASPRAITPWGWRSSRCRPGCCA